MVLICYVTLKYTGAYTRFGSGPGDILHEIQKGNYSEILSEDVKGASILKK